jgi:hypothetical protein
VSVVYCTTSPKKKLDAGGGVNGAPDPNMLTKKDVASAVSGAAGDVGQRRVAGRVSQHERGE